MPSPIPVVILRSPQDAVPAEMAAIYVGAQGPAVPLSDAAPQALAAAADPGESASAARADHVHPVPSYNALADKPTLGTAAAQDVGAFVGASDARLTDARTPTGSAGGALAGSYPNPGFAVDMATQAELDNVVDSLAQPAGASLVGYSIGEVGAIATTLEQKAKDEMRSALDWGHVISPTTPFPYPAGLPIDVLQGNKGEQFAIALAKAMEFTDLPTFKLNARAAKAFAAGSVRITFVGDSITAGADNWGSNTYTALLKTQLKQAFPWVDFHFQNLAIAGVGAYTINSDTYKGAASLGDFVLGSNFWFTENLGGANTNTTVERLGIALLNEEYWPDGSTYNKSWKDHVVDSNPDIIVWAFGMNDGVDYVDFYNNYEAFQAYIAAQMSASLPWFTLVSCFLPDMIPPNGQPHATWQVPGQCISDQVKYLAQRDSYGLIDANSVFNLLREGKRYDHQTYTHEYNWENASDPTKWIIDGTLPISGGIASGYGVAVRNITARDIDISVNFTVQSFASGYCVIRVKYRAEPGGGGPFTGYSADIVINNSSNTLTMVLYHRLTQLAVAYQTIAAEPSVGYEGTIKVKAYGDRHELWLNGKKAIDTTDQRSMYAGNIMLSVAQGSGDIYYPGISYSNARDTHTTVDRKMLLGTPVFDEGGAFVLYSDFSVNTASLGGNVVNHPSAWGHNTFYGLGISRFIKALKALILQPLKMSASTTVAHSVVSAADTPEVVSTIPIITIKIARKTQVGITLVASYESDTVSGNCQIGVFVDSVWSGLYIPQSTALGAGFMTATVRLEQVLAAGTHTFQFGAVRGTGTSTLNITPAGTQSSIIVEEVL